MVYYRKYRPQTIEELDSAPVRETLLSIFKNPNNVAHAFLFTGSKGLGKTSTARIVAKLVNCTGKKKGSIEPCNKCLQCISITNGSNLDVLEIDGASNRGIDEIRDLREKIKLAPASAQRKVYIIDEVHMLTTEAFNALLKTLEEPPPHAMFILCTTEFHKVPETISSRCFHVSFGKATGEELARSLARIAKGEKLNVGTEALEYIARLSDGAFRDGAKILEEVMLSADGKKITKELVEVKYKTLNISQHVSDMIFTFESKNPRSGLQLVSKLIEQGVDVKFFIEQLIDELHGLLLLEFLNRKEIDSKNYPKLTVEQIQSLIKLLATAHQETKYSVLPQLPLELAIVDWCSQSLESEAQNLELNTTEQKTMPQVQVPSDKPQGDFWSTFIIQVKKHNSLIAGVLRSCSLQKMENGSLSISTKFKFHKEKIESSLALLEEAAEELTGNKITVSIQLIQ